MIMITTNKERDGMVADPVQMVWHELQGWTCHFSAFCTRHILSDFV